MQSAVSILPIAQTNEEVERKAHTLSSSPPKPRNVTTFASARNALKQILDVARTNASVKYPNGAVAIYDDLFTKLGNCNDFQDFWPKHDNLRLTVDNIFAYVSTEDSYVVCDDPVAKKKIGCRLISHYLQLLLCPRFVPEKPKPPQESMNDHIVEWLNANESLNFDGADKTLVQSAYLLLFVI
jgi:hypothetical protein